jgi:proteasome lid subunit RPN8/RPN11
MIEEIKKHFEKEYPREGCGVIGIVKGKKKWFPCINTTATNENFVMSSLEYLDIKRKADIFAIVHSHPDATNEPSQHDIDCCNALGIPYYIFSYPEMELNIIEPKTKAYPLIGREYQFGKLDCFEAMRDWLAKENIYIPPREPFEDDWWSKGLNYFTEENIKNWKHKKVETLEKNDVLIFTVRNKVANHCGVYLGNDIFFHHAENRISCRENLYPFWAQNLTGIYRYVA